MVARVLDFAAAYPSTDASYTALVTRMRDRASRADELAVQQRDGRMQQLAATGRRRAARDTIQRVQLRHLVRVAGLAAKDHPELKALVAKLPKAGPHKTIITVAKALYTAAITQKNALVAAGLGDTFLDELKSSIADFDQATLDVHTGVRAHVGAAADLMSVTDECVQIAALLDGFYQVRFRAVPEAMAAWTSAHNVVGPFQHRAALGDTPATPIEPGAPVVEPPKQLPPMAEAA